MSELLKSRNLALSEALEDLAAKPNDPSLRLVALQAICELVLAIDQDPDLSLKIALLTLATTSQLVINLPYYLRLDPDRVRGTLLSNAKLYKKESGL